MKTLKLLTKIILCTLFSLQASAQKQANPDIPVPEMLSIDKGLTPAQAKVQKDAALWFYAFWNTGKKIYLDKAIAPNFIDHTLPPGRPQGPAGPLFSSSNFRKAVPDLKCNVKDLLITGDKVTVRMIFTGTFKGDFMGQKATGKHIEFLAIDILQIGNGKIVADWHLEDNLALYKQLGVVK